MQIGLKEKCPTVLFQEVTQKKGGSIALPYPDGSITGEFDWRAPEGNDIRELLSPGLKFAITLRQLATGESCMACSITSWWAIQQS